LWKRRIKYTILSGQKLAEKYGSITEAFEKIEKPDPKITKEGLADTVFILKAGLSREDADLALDDIADSIPLVRFKEVRDLIIKSIDNSLPNPEESGGSEGGPGEPV